ncbi:wall-associated receptor kinase-like 20 [Punica granatum]|uniref:Wall-associated receptor kinase galacturonan-binding domain-containing protein n=2 Tax=Punica granatum TaxID=22663 RepID=A0A218WI04_PUNGR|nr:wall-associated receptor kinase-like 20 [Punica granatum]OWM72445.1 hypothetical protein CDL15_Pgr018330 [Punica granatum]PKI76161.1 hypothetical protein CRG98_003522 [Punica granatum]
MEPVPAAAFLFLFIIQLPSSSPSSGSPPCPKCGPTEVPYPLSTDDNCGEPSYRVHCSTSVNGSTSLEFMSADGIYYKILSIDPASRRLVVSPPSILKDTCLSSDLDSGGMRLDEDSPFNISTRNTVMLFNCSKNILASPLNCSSNSLCRQYEDSVAVARGCRGSLCCHYLKDSAMTSHRIRVRVGGCTAYTAMVNVNATEPVESWDYGVELQWAPPS